MCPYNHYTFCELILLCHAVTVHRLNYNHV
jgi:hypothetical protein